MVPAGEKNPLTVYESKFLSVTELSAINPRPSPNERLNVLGVVHQLGNVRSIDKTNKVRLNIELVDAVAKPFRSIVLCIWEKSSVPEKNEGDEMSFTSQQKQFEQSMFDDKAQGVINRL